MARSLNGTSDLIDAGTGVNSPSAITISCWAKPTSLANAYSAIVSRDQAGGANDYQLFLKSSGLLAIYVGGSIGSSNYDPGNTTLSTGTWYHLAFVYSSSGGLIGYVNGSQDKTAAANGTLNAVSANFQIGNDQQNAGRNFGGSIADVCQWNVVLTAAEILALAKGARPFTVRPLSIDGYWPLDGLQSPEPDLSGNAHNGTLTGTALASGPPTMMFSPRTPFIMPKVAAAGQSFQPAWAMRNRIVVEGIGI